MRLSSSPITRRIIDFILHANRAVYGYELVKAANVNIQTVYQVLHNLEKGGFLVKCKKSSNPLPTGARRIYYAVCEEKRAQLSRMVQEGRSERTKANVIKFLLSTDDEVYAYQVAKASNVNAGTVSRMLYKLTADGHLERVTDKLDFNKPGPARVYYRVREGHQDYLNKIAQTTRG